MTMKDLKEGDVFHYRFKFTGPGGDVHFRYIAKVKEVGDDMVIFDDIMSLENTESLEENVACNTTSSIKDSELFDQIIIFKSLIDAKQKNPEFFL